MKMLRQITVFLALALAPAAFCATITANSAVTYTDGGVVKTLAAGDTLTITDGDTFELVRGAISVSGTAAVDAGNGTAEVSGGSMFVEVKGNRARVSNIGDSGAVSFTKPSGDETSIDSGSEIFSAASTTDTLVVVVEEIGATDLPGFDVDPVPTGTPL